MLHSKFIDRSTEFILDQLSLRRKVNQYSSNNNNFPESYRNRTNMEKCFLVVIYFFEKPIAIPQELPNCCRICFVVDILKTVKRLLGKHHNKSLLSPIFQLVVLKMDEDGLLVFSVSWSEFFVFMSLVSHKYVKEKDSVSMKPARFYKQICYGRMG